MKQEGTLGNFAQTFLGNLHVTLDWLPIALSAGVLIWIFAYSDIAVSASMTLILEGISILLILILTIVILVRGGASGSLTAQPFVPGNQPFSTIGLAAVFGFLSLAGFEGTATLGEETRNPRRSIPLFILVAVVGTGLLYVLITYAQTIGFGTSNAGIKAFGASTTPLGGSQFALRWRCHGNVH